MFFTVSTQNSNSREPPPPNQTDPNGFADATQALTETPLNINPVTCYTEETCKATFCKSVSAFSLSCQFEKLFCLDEEVKMTSRPEIQQIYRFYLTLQQDPSTKATLYTHKIRDMYYYLIFI